MGGLLYIFFVAAVAYFAKSKGRSPLGWALIAVFISPLLAGIILFFMKNLNTNRYDGDTIDTTAKPIPDESPKRYPERGQIPANKSKVDVDESIRRMEEKLAQTKNKETISNASDGGVTSNGAVTGVIMPSVQDVQIKTNQSYEEVKEVDHEVVDLKSEDAVQNEERIDDGAVIQGDFESNEESLASLVCESCGQPLTPGGKFCTNCGAPVTK